MKIIKSSVMPGGLNRVFVDDVGIFKVDIFNII